MLLNENCCEGPKTLRKFVAELRELASVGTTIRSLRKYFVISVNAKGSNSFDSVGKGISASYLPFS